MESLLGSRSLRWGTSTLGPTDILTLILGPPWNGGPCISLDTGQWSANWVALSFISIFLDSFPPEEGGKREVSWCHKKKQREICSLSELRWANDSCHLFLSKSFYTQEGYSKLSEWQAPISPKTLGSNPSECIFACLLACLKSIIGRAPISPNFPTFLNGLFITFKCQIFEKSYKIFFKELLISTLNFIIFK